MQPQRLAVVGFGKLGQACARAILDDRELTLAAIVRRSDSLAAAVTAPFDGVPRAAHIQDLAGIHAALICVPPAQVLATARDALQARIGVIECATLHGEAFARHHNELNRLAALRKTPAICGAGWDPGALSLLRGLFALLCPKGHTEMRRHPGSSLHHTALAGVSGVRSALATESRDPSDGVRRYVYVELEPGIEFAPVERAIRGDPLYAGERTQVFAVENVAALEAQAGIALERRGSTAMPHTQLFLEARFTEPALSAAVMLAAARAMPRLAEHRAYNLFELPLGLLWGALAPKLMQEWL